MTETRKAGAFVVATIAFAVGFTAWDATVFDGWTMFSIEAVILAVAFPTGYGSVQWWLAAVDAAQKGRHIRPATTARDRVHRYVARAGDRGGRVWVADTPAEDAYDTEESFTPDHTDDGTTFFPWGDEADTDVLPTVREEVAR